MPCNNLFFIRIFTVNVLFEYSLNLSRVHIIYYFFHALTFSFRYNFINNTKVV